METPPEEYAGGYYHGGVYAERAPDGGMQFAFRPFDTADQDRANFDLDRLETDDELAEKAIDSVGRGMEPEDFMPDTLVTAISFDERVRQGVEVGAVDNGPGLNDLHERKTNEDGDLRVTPGSGWETVAPRDALQLSDGDYIDAVFDGPVMERADIGIVFGFMDDRAKLYRPQGNTDVAFLYDWDPDTESLGSRSDDLQDSMANLYAPRVAKSDPNDPYIGYIPESDVGNRNFQLMKVSDAPIGYTLDPFFQSADEVEELIGDTVLARSSGGVVKEVEVLRPIPDAAGVQVRWAAGLNYDYIIPASSMHGDRDVDIIGVPASNPLRGQTGDRRSWVRDNIITADGTSWELGGRYIPGEQLPAEMVETVLTFAEEGDVFTLESDQSSVPSGEMVVVDEGGAIDTGEVELVPKQGSRTYFMRALDAPMGDSRAPPAPLRLRLDGESVGRIQGFTIRAGDPPDTADSPTDPGDEAGDMSERAPADSVSRSYEALGLDRNEVRTALQDNGFATELKDINQIGPSRAESIQSAGVRDAADLAVVFTAHRKARGFDPDAWGDITAGLPSRGLSAVEEYAETVGEMLIQPMADLESFDPTPSDEPEPDPGTFPATVTAFVSVPGEVVDPSQVGVDYEPSPPAAVSDSTIEEATRRIEILAGDSEMVTGEVEMEVVFRGPDDYSIETDIQFIDFTLPERLEFEGEVDMSGAPGGPADVVLTTNGGTRLEVYDAAVWAYPEDVSPAAEKVDKRKAKKLDALAPDLLERAEEDGQFAIVQDNRPDRDSGGDDGGTGEITGDLVDEGEDVEEMFSDEDDEDDPISSGLTPSEVALELEEAMPGTAAKVTRDDGMVLVEWRSLESQGGTLSQESAVADAPDDQAESAISRAVQAYDSNVVKSTVDPTGINQLREDSPLDLPLMDSPDPAEEASETATQDDSGDAIGGEKFGPLPTDVFGTNTVRQVASAMDELIPDPDPDTGEQRAPRGATPADVFPVFEPLEDALIAKADGMVEGLAVEPAYAPSGELIGYNVEPVLTDDGRSRVAGADTFLPIDLSVPLRDPVSRMADVVGVLRALDTESGENESTHRKLAEMERVTDDRVRRGDVDFDQMFLTADEISSFSRFVPELYDNDIARYTESIDRSYTIAQLAFAAVTGDDVFEEQFVDYVEGIRPGRRPRAVADEAREEVQSGSFDPEDFVREFWRVAEGERQRGDIIAETQRSQQEAQSQLGRAREEELLEQPGGVAVEIFREPGAGRFGLQPIPEGSDEPLDPNNDMVDLGLLFVDGEVDAEDYAEGELVATAQLSDDGASDIDPAPPSGDSSGGDDEPDARSGGRGGQPQGSDPGDRPSSEPEPEPEPEPDPGTADRPSSDPEREPEPRPGPDQPAGGATTIERQEVDTFEADDVDVENVDINISGDVAADINRVDVETVESIRSDIEDDIGE